ncbi:MAG: hypothetical protein NC293_08995 [Roseburia sp.]|nr:hypothetical protein [Roseburia sp.]
MEKKEMIFQLEKLAAYCESMNVENNAESVWGKDAEALKMVIALLSEEVFVEKPIDTVKFLLKRDNLTQQKLADRMGTLRQNVNQMLSRAKNDMKYSSFKKMISVLGYEVVLRKNVK